MRVPSLYSIYFGNKYEQRKVKIYRSIENSTGFHNILLVSKNDVAIVIIYQKYGVKLFFSRGIENIDICCCNSVNP
jgi:hypothetical protein